MDNVRILIVDDEELARVRLRRLLSREPDVNVMGECCDGTEAYAFILEHTPDLVFLDVHMREMDGLQLIEQLPPERRPCIVLVTAYDYYALDAFDLEVVDYLLKPYSDERFAMALRRAKERIRQKHIALHTDRLLALLQGTTASPSAGPLRAESRPPHGRLVVKSGSHFLFVDPNHVDWIEAEGVYLRLHMDKKSYLLRESLNSFEERLDPHQFIRIHRSSIVNVDRIREVIPHANGGSVVVLQDGRQLRMSRSYRDRLSAMLG